MFVRTPFPIAVLLLALGVPAAARSQISPGDLSSAHAQLEGIGKCTQCHDLGRMIANDKCLQCHTELQTRIAAHTGLHARYTGRQCVECHKEHHGRNFSLVRMDRSTFDHSVVGFTLEGAHRQLGCDKCHRQEFIRSPDVLKNTAAIGRGTYLGLSEQCSSCHNDIHRGQFKASCSQCHTPDTWKPASKFVHDNARFRLTGRHAQVACNGCHKADAAKVVRFAGLQFGSCQSCHSDPHAGRFHERCETCHTTMGWKEVAAGKFDHANTRFPLRGRHAAVRCEQCHGSRPGKTNAGLHIAKFERCSDCHADAHDRQFAARPDGGACESCHTVDGFSPSTYPVAEHQRTTFPLTGGHLAVPCRACHKENAVAAKSTRRFHWPKPVQCETCHQDIHRGEFVTAASNGCSSCHVTDGWKAVRYSHERTRFPLRGKHLELACAQCHIITGSVSEGKGIPVADTTRTIADAPARLLRWKGPIQCGTCHPDIHRGQFVPRHGAVCETCHTTRTWNELIFSHNDTAFPLTGKHAAVPCVQCHKLVGEGTPSQYRIYAGTPSRCADCHAAAQ